MMMMNGHDDMMKNYENDDNYILDYDLHVSFSRLCKSFCVHSVTQQKNQGNFFRGKTAQEKVSKKKLSHAQFHEIN